MANDRMFVKCGVCGETLMIAKSFGHGWQVWGADNPAINPDADVPFVSSTLPQSKIEVRTPQFSVGRRLEEWLEAHEHDNANEVGSTDHFELVYEHRDNA